MLLMILSSGMSSWVLAQDASTTSEATQISAGDTAWVLTSSAIVLAMTVPGSSALLWRNGQREKCAGNPHAQFCISLFGERDLGSVGL